MEANREGDRAMRQVFKLTTAIVTGALALAPCVVASKLSAAPIAYSTAQIDTVTGHL